MISKYLSQDSICKNSCPNLVLDDALNVLSVRGDGTVQDEQNQEVNRLHTGHIIHILDNLKII